MDFYQIKEKIIKKDVIEIYPDFKVGRSKDLMVRGKSFYAIWDEKKNLWSTDEYDVQRLVDEELLAHKELLLSKSDAKVNVKLMSDFSTRSWLDFRSYLNHMSDNSHQLDNRLIFSNTEVKKKDYISRRLNYPLEGGKYDAFNELIGTLYDPDERAKLEWAIGAIVSGDAKDIQKFIVLYGEAGAGKSTILNIIQKLFEGYYTAFEAKALTSASNSFATEVFKNNPLVAIQHDGDLSKIEDNTKLNSIISHEEMTMNEKYKPSYMSRINCFLFMGTNKPVKITDAKSGIIRRLIDVKPSGRKLQPKHYQSIMSKIDFELGAIAHHCLEVYREMGKNYYASYKPLDMILQTDMFFNFVESNYHIFKEQDGTTLAQAYDMYKEYCEDSSIEFKIPKYKFREEIKNYFSEFHERTRVEGSQTRSYYSGFISSKFNNIACVKEEHQSSLVLDEEESILDGILENCKAQYATDYTIDDVVKKDVPTNKWVKVQTTLSDINTKKLHYVKPPENHIVIDFDLKDESGNKSLEKNLDAASKWPSTYSEFSKSGAGLHLHYIYDGDIKKLSRIYDQGIEIKIFNGDASLRRQLTKCNNIPITTINSGLPLKGEPMINFDVVKSEKSIREMIKRNLRKEIHPGTKPSIDFIHKILDDAYVSGVPYDVTDMRPSVLAFANNSSNQSDYCVRVVGGMDFKSEEKEFDISNATYVDKELVFFDVEVFPNLFVVVWKVQGKPPVKMINPTAEQIELLFNFKLIGFNCRRYDNHILYARYIGYTNQQLYTLSQRIISGSPNCMFGEAYNISYTDVYDFASAGNKKSLKKFEIELGIHHQELGLPWDQPVPEDKWGLVADYCVNDVVATEVVFDHLAGDWAVRQILAELSGLTYNDTTNQHSIKIVFGDNKNPQKDFVYTDLSIQFPGYKFENGKSTYRGEEVGEGGWVYAEPGMYINVPVLDAAAMHPTSIEQLNLFGPYTKKYSDVKRGRLAIKHKDFESLNTILDGRLIPFVENALSDKPRFTLKDVSNGLKTALNSAYGLTSASFENPFKDPRNIDNIVAKRGALFMIDLKNAVQEKGYNVAHIKTDSIKVPNASQEVIDFIVSFGKSYGYDFEHETTYEKMCLVNHAVYIAKVKDWEKDKDLIPTQGWTATGAQFAQPYVFKTLFSKEALSYSDFRETKAVTTAMYLDMNENLGDEHDYHFVGRVGAFCPIVSGRGGGILLREKDGKYYAVGGTKGYRWLEAEIVKALNKEGHIDMEYYKEMANDAIDTISKFGDFEWFVSDNKTHNFCKKNESKGCCDCESWINTEHHANTCLLGYDCLPF
jgi:energy-coupling factor transporter ATP-binding protein EcfA2